MPELPDITIYIEALEARVLGQRLDAVRLASPFLLRTATPPITAVAGRRVRHLRRIGKRIAIGLDDELWLVLHLMIAGRLSWHDAGAKPPAKRGLAAFDFSTGTLILTEAGSRKRASLHLVSGAVALDALDPGGLEVLNADIDVFGAALTQANHTLKRALTDPRLFSGIGNAYGDEILHRARLSPIAMTGKLTREEIARLHEAVQDTLRAWTDTLRAETGSGFPGKVTAFRDGMAVHGRYRKPCPDCGTAIQRIRYAANETNYCPRCQTGGKVLADRSLSRLLKKDWPRTVEELEQVGRPAAG
ncbi:MAG: DNA-formamidopyrimidine glycosylase family protein [Alphaproteobacteria bacterium]|jgi:formamidopyrimidine-DNA glycosylase|nr:DNA-formamidopyrimidine glycosylase family protein [Alphaproteobacteria bacterium]MDP6515136.1 DNA-formamidopyrimidine glycosylase family protein [Alphaproteobacteria bacterium]